MTEGGYRDYGEMVSREQKRAALHEKLQLLRSLTNSHALRKSSIILDASKYIQDLKQKVGRLKQEIACTQSQVLQNNNSSLCSPQVIVETLEKGFLINVYSEKSCPGLLASVLDAFEQLGLHVVEAKASCTDAFRLVAIGREAESMEAQAVKEAVQRAVSCLFEEDSEEDMDD